MMRIDKTISATNSDLITGITTANYGGTLTVNNIGSAALAGGEQFTLFSAGAHTGNFSGIVGTPGPGLIYSFSAANGVLSVVTGKTPPHITSFSLSGPTLMMSGTNGTPNGAYVLLGSTNVALPLMQWTPLLTNSFDGSGNFSLSTNIINPALPQEFYLLSQ